MQVSVTLRSEIEDHWHTAELAAGRCLWRGSESLSSAREVGTQGALGRIEEGLTSGEKVEGLGSVVGVCMHLGREGNTFFVQ